MLKHLPYIVLEYDHAGLWHVIEYETYDQALENTNFSNGDLLVKRLHLPTRAKIKEEGQE